MNYYLKLLTENDEKAFLTFEENWGEEKKIPFAFNRQDLSYADWLKRENEFHTNAPEGFVTAHTYFLTDDRGVLMGALNLRHYLNENLLATGGHIGYGIAPSFRGKGLAKLQCKLGLEKARKLGIEKVLITCLVQNEASARTIESCGGVLEDIRAGSDGSTYKRYWIDLSNEN